MISHITTVPYGLNSHSMCSPGFCPVLPGILMESANQIRETIYFILIFSQEKTNLDPRAEVRPWVSMDRGLEGGGTMGIGDQGLGRRLGNGHRQSGAWQEVE